MKTELYQDEKTGLYLERQVKMEKRERMTLNEWRAYYADAEFTEEEFIEFCTKFRRPPDAWRRT